MSTRAAPSTGAGSHQQPRARFAAARQGGDDEAVDYEAEDMDYSAGEVGMTDTVETSLASRAGRLFAAYRDGDPSKMSDLVRLLTPILWHTVRASRLDTATAEDVVQTVWLALVRRADTISEPLAVLQWMVVTAKPEAWRVARLQARCDQRTWMPVLPAARTAPTRSRMRWNVTTSRIGSGTTSRSSRSGAALCSG